jgi:hypothetical protein
VDCGKGLKGSRDLSCVVYVSVVCDGSYPISVMAGRTAADG